MEEKEIQKVWERLEEIRQKLDANPNLTKKELIDLIKELEGLKEKYKETKVEERIIIVYTWVLAALTAEQDLKEAEQSVEKLRELKEAYQGKKSEETIVISYAQALANLTAKQNLKGIEKSVEKLKELKEDYQGKEIKEKIVIAYAQALVNLAIKQELEEAEKSVEELKKIKEAYQGKESEKEIVNYYAQALVSITVKQDLGGREKSVEKLKGLREDYQGKEIEEEIVNYYAQALVNLAIKQELEEVEKSIEELKKIKEAYQGKESEKEIINYYAQALANMMVKQDLGGREKSVEKLERLKEAYQGKEFEEKIVIFYAMGLAGLTAKQDLEGREQSVEKLKELKEVYQGKESEKEIVGYYALSLYNLTAKQDLEEIEQSVEKLKELKEVYQGKEPEKEIVISYVQALFNLTTKQDLKGIEQSVKKIEELKEADQGKEPEKEIVISYAKALANLTAKQDLEGIEQSVEKLKELKEAYQGKESEKEIVIAYAQALYNLTVGQDLEGREKSVEKLKELKEAYQGEEIVIVYALALTTLIKNHLVNGEKSIEELEELKGCVFSYYKDITILTIYADQIFQMDKSSLKLNLKEVQEKFEVEKINAIEILLANKKWKNLDYFLKNSGTKELKKLLVDFLIIYFSYRKIMEELLFEDKEIKLSHYTSMKVLPKLIKPKEENKDSSDNTKTPVRLRCYNVAYMNDPEEGKCLYDYLRKIPRKKEKTKQDQEQKQERRKKWLAENIFSPETENKYGVYFSSLTKAEDNLPMWQSYSAAGTGCSLVFKDDFFAEEIEEESFSTIFSSKQKIKGEVVAPMVLLGEESAGKTSNNAGVSSDDEKKDMKELKIYAYKVFYIDKPEKNQDNEKKKDKIEDYVDLIRDSLWKIAEYFTEDKNLEPTCPDYLRTFLISCLDEIRYLFKSSDYSYEQEVRLLKQVPYSDPSVKLDCERDGLPRTYIEYPKDLEYTEVILGPKAPKREEVAPYIEYCNQRNGTSIKIRSSEIKYR